jgi:hypothetical protein
MQEKALNSLPKLLPFFFGQHGSSSPNDVHSFSCALAFFGGVNFERSFQSEGFRLPWAELKVLSVSVRF